VGGDHVVEDERDLVVPAATFRYFRVRRNDPPGPPTQKYVPSNSQATGTTSGWPPSATVASRAKGRARR